MQNLHDFMSNNLRAMPQCRPLQRRHFLLMGAVLALGGTSAVGAAVPAAPIRVLAASGLKFVLTRIAAQYQKETGQVLELTFGSSGNMARQIQQGLPADLFMSADEDFVLQLARANLTQGGSSGVVYAQGRIVLYLPPGSPITPDARLQGVREQWARVHKFALANPEHAPYGRAGREALQSLKLWDMVQPRLVLGENIAQATQYVSTGAAQAGITALSLVMAPELQGLGQYVVLPAELHAPLSQRMVLLAKASAAASAFYTHLQQPAVRALMAQYGYMLPP